MQLDMFPPPWPKAMWQRGDPGIRGAYQLMNRLPNDPDDGEGKKDDRRKTGRDEGKSGRALTDEARALDKGDPRRFSDAIERLLHKAIGGDDKPRTMHAIGMDLINKPGDITVGSMLEESVWELVAYGSLRWGYALAACSFTRGRATSPALIRYRPERRRPLKTLPRYWLDCIVFAPWPKDAPLND